MPNGRCRMHGGKVPNGMMLPQTKTGRYSKYLPVRLAGRYEEAQRDEDLLALREEVALVDARIADLLDRVDTGESGDAWKQAEQALEEFRQALAEQNATKRKMAFAALSVAINNGRQDYDAWNEIHKLVDQRRRLVESERKRLEQMGQMVAVEQFMLLIAQIVDLLRRHVHDRDTLATLSAEINRLVTIDKRD